MRDSYLLLVAPPTSRIPCVETHAGYEKVVPAKRRRLRLVSMRTCGHRRSYRGYDAGHMFCPGHTHALCLEEG
jgi:hypothetical protein